MSSGDAVANNEKVLETYAQKLSSDDLSTYSRFVDKFGAWLKSERAYYAAVRPKILELLEVAQSTLHRQTGVKHALPSTFNPWVEAYFRLIREVIPHTHFFTEAGAQDRLRVLIHSSKNGSGHIQPFAQHIIPSSMTYPAPVNSGSLHQLPIVNAPVTMHANSSSLASALVMDHQGVASHAKHMPTSSIPARESLNDPPQATLIPTQVLPHVPSKVPSSLPSTNPSTSVTSKLPPVTGINSTNIKSTESSSTSAPAKPKVKKKRKSTNYAEFLVADLEWYKNKDKDKDRGRDGDKNTLIPGSSVPSNPTDSTNASGGQPSRPVSLAQPEARTIGELTTSVVPESAKLAEVSSVSQAENVMEAIEISGVSRHITTEGLDPNLPPSLSPSGTVVPEQKTQCAVSSGRSETLQTPPLNDTEIDSVAPQVFAATEETNQLLNTPNYLTTISGEVRAEGLSTSDPGLDRVLPSLKPAADESSFLPLNEDLAERADPTHSTVAQDNDRHKRLSDNSADPVLTNQPDVIEDSTGEVNPDIYRSTDAGKDDVSADPEPRVPDVSACPVELLPAPTVGFQITSEPEGSGIPTTPISIDKPLPPSTFGFKDGPERGPSVPQISSTEVLLTSDHTLEPVVGHVGRKELQSQTENKDVPSETLITVDCADPPNPIQDEEAIPYSPIVVDSDPLPLVENHSGGLTESPMECDVVLDAFSVAKLGADIQVDKQCEIVDGSRMDVDVNVDADPSRTVDQSTSEPSISLNRLQSPAVSELPEIRSVQQDIEGSAQIILPIVNGEQVPLNNLRPVVSRPFSPGAHSLGLPIHTNGLASPNKIFGPEMVAIIVQRGSTAKEMITIEFTIDQDLFALISKWNNRNNISEDVSSALCFSLACYPCGEEIKIEELSLEEISSAGSSWPTTGGLAINVKYDGGRHTFPLSPPFVVTPDNLVDVSPFLELGHNTMYIRQHRGTSQYILILHAHFPTDKQLEEIARQRQGNLDWEAWRQEMLKPINVPLLWQEV